MASKREDEYNGSDEGDSEGDDEEKASRPRRPRVECIMGNKSLEELRNTHP